MIIKRDMASETRFPGKSSELGFTLIELLVVVGMIGILVGITLGITGWANRKSAVSRALAEMEVIKSALEEYRLENAQYYVVNGTIQIDQDGGAFSNNVGRFVSGGIRITDPWGRGYFYTTFNSRPAMSYRLFSEGPTTNAFDNVEATTGNF